MPLLEALLAVIVPFLVQEAEKLIGKGAPDGVNPPNGAGAEKHAWVSAAVNDFVGALEGKVPNWVKPEIEAIKPVLNDLIEQAVAKL